MLTLWHSVGIYSSQPVIDLVVLNVLIIIVNLKLFHLKKGITKSPYRNRIAYSDR